MNQQAKQAGERAEQLLRELNEQSATPPPDQQAGNTDLSAPALSDAPPRGAQDAEDPKDGEIKSLKHQLSVLQGKYRAEVPRVHQLMKQQTEKMQSRIEDLERQLSEKNARKDYFSSVAEEFGDETAQKLQSSVAGMLEDRIPASQQTIQSEQNIDEIMRSKEQYVIDLVGGHDAFHKIDTDPGFNAWLDEFDPRTGVQRRQSMIATFQGGQLSDTADVYLEWAKKQAQPAPKSSQDNTNRSLLEEQVQPGSVQNTQNTGTLKKTYTSSEYKSIMTDLARNQKYRRTEEGRKQAAAIRNELNAALSEGRITHDIPPPIVTDPYKLDHSA